jgi:A/G-specific adenine glycosylase
VRTPVADHAIRWYARAARDLPWRAPGTTPWGVLVSEVMLQQTPVARVLPAYVEWMRRWPEPAALAAAPAGLAIQAWGRLGYPRRALRLHQCAAVIAERYDGVVPRRLAELLALPGVGQYTARAVAAFAYGQREPVVDTNVRRLMARIVHGVADGGSATSTADLATVARLLPIAPARAARASIAFMELGALICTARRPACDACPVRQHCAWRQGSDAIGGPDPGRTAVEQPDHRPRRPSQRYEGTDRQARGALLAICRAHPLGVPGRVLDEAWADTSQRTRALRGLLHDGLVIAIDDDRYGLPGLAVPQRQAADRGATGAGGEPIPSRA